MNIRNKIVLLLLTCCLHSGVKAEDVPEWMTAEEPTRDLVYECAKHYGLQYPEIVTAQSVLETGHYKSRLCRKSNNLFGLYDSKKRRYREYKSWQESVKAYKKLIQYKYESGCYYKFLQRIGYAEDPSYVSRVRNITCRYWNICE